MKIALYCRPFYAFLNVSRKRRVQCALASQKTIPSIICNFHSNAMEQPFIFEYPTDVVPGIFNPNPMLYMFCWYECVH